MLDPWWSQKPLKYMLALTSFHRSKRLNIHLLLPMKQADHALVAALAAFAYDPSLHHAQVHKLQFGVTAMTHLAKAKKSLFFQQQKIF